MAYTELVQKQRDFYLSGQTRPLHYRLGQLSKLKKVIEKHESDLYDALKKDLGKCAFEAYVSEYGYTLDELNHHIKHLEEWAEEKTVGTPLHLKPANSVVLNEPYGVASIFAPWNYPFQLLLTPAIGAISAGNCAILKPADLTPNTQKLILEMINDNFNENYLHAIGGGIPESEELLKERMDFIFFTGSPRVGKIIMKAASEHLTPVCLELGGKSPCVVDETA